MFEVPELTAVQWRMVEELVRRELRDLPGELHHTVDWTLREELRSRKAMLEDLLQRLHPMPVG